LPHLDFSKDQIFFDLRILGTTHIAVFIFSGKPRRKLRKKILQGRTTLKLRGKKPRIRRLKKMRVDIWSGMFLFQPAMFFYYFNLRRYFI